jgi:flagellar hook assembly protein FlgD
MRFAANGDLFVSSLADGKILKITFPTTAVTTRSTTTLPQNPTLEQNYPNPFNPETKISFELPKASRVVLKVFNLQGQEIRTLLNEEKPAGAFEALWDGKDNAGRQMPSGTYLYRIEAQGLVQTKKMVLLQ